MFENENIKITDFEVSGINNIKIYFSGEKKLNSVFKVLVDEKSVILNNNNSLDKEYIYNRILNVNQNKFNYMIKLPKKSKIVKIYFNDEEVFNYRINKISRIVQEFFKAEKKIRKKIIRLPKIIVKTIKIMWQRHHFLVPPRLIKQYMHSFSNNINNKNVDELFFNPLVSSDYILWLEHQKKNEKLKKLKYNPLISIIIPTYNVSSKLLKECLESILKQSYTNFEVCIADDCSTLKETIDTLKEYEKNEKIKIVYRSENGHISRASNSALSVATGEFIALVDNDDVLDKDALYYMVEKINVDTKLDMVYSDEDKLDLNNKRCMPHFKPDFSLDTLLSVNYICHFTMIRKKIVDELGGFRSDFDGAQDYDLFLRVVEKTKRIGHVSKILYHWRMTETSTSSKSSNKSYVIDNGKKVVEDYLKRNNIAGSVTLVNDIQMYQINYEIENEPKISIIITTKDKCDVLKKCIDSIYNKTVYKNYEIIVIDNNSNEKSTFELLEQYKKEYKNFSYYRLECEFNFSYINNYAVKKATGKYVVLLNNDTEIITENWLNYMVGYASQKHIGCVGAKLLYPNRTIQHCGVVTGVGGIAMHSFVETGENTKGYFGRLVGVYDWSCVTAACLMIQKKKYDDLLGLDEKLKVAYNDVDFCLKSLDKGYYNVVLPQVKLFHYESLSRGNDLSESQRERFTNEINYMCDKWGKKILYDRFYNNNLSHTYAFRLDKEDLHE